MYPKLLLSLTLTFLFTSVLPGTAQFGQPGTAPPRAQSQGTTATFPTDSHPSSTMPPETTAPPPTASSNFKVAGQIRSAIAEEHRLGRETVDVGVTDSLVVLEGEVSGHKDRYIAIQIAFDYSGSRGVRDNLRLRGER